MDVEKGRASTIYLLVDPRTNTGMYVGATTSSVRRRLTYHRNAAIGGNSNLPVAIWIRELDSLGLTPVAVELEAVDGSGDWQASERLWIAEFRNKNPQLLNQTAGGLGTIGHRLSEAHKQRISQANSRAISVSCDNCGKVVSKQKCRAEKNKNNFCSKECYTDWHKVHYSIPDNTGKPSPHRGIKKSEDARARIALANQAHRKCSDSDISEIKRLRESGVTAKEIAKKFGVADRTVRTWLKLPSRDA